MRLGYSITSFHGGGTPREAASETIRLAEIAREAGVDYVQAGDHHVVTGGFYLQNVPTAARLAGVFDRVGAMFLLPLYDPVLVAEQVGTLDALVDEFDFWCAVGGGESAFRAFGVPIEERAARFEESLALLRRLWTDDGVSFDGEFYRADDVSVNPKADPRICVGGIAESAVRRAGRLGDAWVAGPAETLADLERKVEWIREETDERGEDVDIVVRRDVVGLGDAERARGVRDGILSSGYRGWSADAEWTLAGDAGALAGEFDRLRDAGADEVVVRPMSGDHAEETLRTVVEARERI